MKSRLSFFGGVSAVSLCAMLAVAPALADDFDVGPAKVTLGGFLAAEGVYRSRDEQADIGSSYSGIPFSNAAQAHTSEMRFTARQSRLSILAQGDANPDTHLAMYGEFDFLGAGQTANSNESNSYNLRIRNLYGTVDWDSLGLELLAGQSWSLVTLNGKGITPRNETPPATIEAQYVVGFGWARQPQIRVVKNWDHQFWLALSAESPQTTIASGASAGQAAGGISVTDGLGGGPLFDKNNVYSLNHMPDFIAKAAWEPRIDGAQPLHIEAFGLLRSYYDRVNVSATNALHLPAGADNSNSQAGGFGGSLTWTAIPQTLDLQATTMIGQGIGRYGSGQLPDVTVRPDGALAPIQEEMVMAGATLHANPYLDLYAYAGQEEESAKYFDVGTTHLGLGNPGYNVAGCAVEGQACSPNLRAVSQITGGFWWKLYNGKFGSFRYGMQYSYTHLNTFNGIGGKPETDDSMVFTSIRYYPF